MPSSNHSSQLYILVEASLAQIWLWFLLMQSSGNTEQPCFQKALALEATERSENDKSTVRLQKDSAGTGASPNIITSSLYISQRLLSKRNCSWQHYPTKQCQPCCYDLFHSYSRLILLCFLINFLNTYMPALLLLKNLPMLQLLTHDFTLYRETKLQVTSLIKGRQL